MPPQARGFDELKAAELDEGNICQIYSAIVGRAPHSALRGRASSRKSSVYSPAHLRPAAISKILNC